MGFTIKDRHKSYKLLQWLGPWGAPLVLFGYKNYKGYPMDLQLFYR